MDDAARQRKNARMKESEIGRQRLMNLQVASSRCRSPGELVSTLGAMQAQDYAGGLWAVGLRLPNATLADVEQALQQRSIVRTWPLRGTLHLVAAGDLGWMLDLLSARVLKVAARREQQLGLDAATFRKVEQVFVRALEGGRQCTRDGLAQALTQANISPENGRLYHCLLYLALHQCICFAVPEGKQPTFALLDEWLPKRLKLEPDQALAELASRYFRSHGPATQQDLMRWAKLGAAEAKRGIASAEGIAELTIAGTRYWTAADQEPPNAAARGTFLLPGFDEYILGYGDRTAILDQEHAHKIVPGANGVFRPTIVHGGKVLGTWKADAGKQTVRLSASPFAASSAAQQRAFATAARRYAAFLGKGLAA